MVTDLLSHGWRSRLHRENKEAEHWLEVNENVGRGSGSESSDHLKPWETITDGLTAGYYAMTGDTDNTTTGEGAEPTGQDDL